MSDEPISVPGGDAAPSAPVVSSEPVATPAAPVTPSAPADAEPTRNLGENPQDYMHRFLEWKDSHKEKVDPAVATGDKAPVVQPVEPVKPVEPAEPVKGEEPKPVAEVKNPLDEVGPLPVSKLAETLTAHPELEKALEDAGINKDELFAGLREGAAAQQYREIFPDVDTAKFAQEASQQLYHMDIAATDLKAGDLASTQKFIQSVLMPMSYILDEEGKPKTNADGTYQTDGTVTALLGNIRDVAMEQVIADAQMLMGQNNEQAKALGERLLAASQEIQEFIKGVSTEGEVSEELKAQRARLDADKAAFAKTTQDKADAEFETFKQGTVQATDAKLNDLIGGLLSQSSLAADPADSPAVKEQKDFVRSGVLREIRDGLHANLSKNTLFLAEQNQIARRGASAGTQKALVNLYNRFANSILESVAKPVLAKAGAERVRQSQARAAKVAAQVKASNTEPKGPTSAAVPHIPKVDVQALTQKAGEQLREEKRRMPTSAEIMERTRQLIAEASKAAAV